ncbi:MAG: outer membrane protein transport protein [Myxococcota bacterium]|nr:outer membrane protein transport protein [Myxococcota bacterium]
MRALLLTLAALSLAPSIAVAQPMDTYGMGSRSVALGGAVTADVEDFSANYYNPAGLVRSGELRVGVGWFGAHHMFEVNGYDSNVDPVHGIVLGLNVPGRIDDFRFAFGLGVHLNDQRVSRTRTLPRERPRWELYDNRGQRTYLATSLSIQPFDWLRIGGGIAFLSYSKNNLLIRGDIDFANPSLNSQLEHQLTAELITIRYPQVGVQVQPLEWLNFGLVYRGEYALDNTLVAEVGTLDSSGRPSIDARDATRIIVGEVVIPGYLSLLSQSVNAYVPHQISFGASVEPTPDLRISFEATYLFWSLYQSPIGSSAIDLRIAVPPELQDTIMVPDSLTQGVPADANFSDRIVPRVGVEYTAVRNTDLAFAVRAGYFYENSPAPNQGGAFNLIDTDRHAWSVGAGLELFQLRPVLPGSLAMDVHFQYGWLPSRTMIKESPIDPIGDYTAEGHMIAGGATIEARFE